MNPDCQECGGACCKHVLVQLPDVTGIDTQWLQVRGTVRRVAGQVIEWRVESPCRELGPDGRCGIYDSRPMSCRTFEVGGDGCIEARKEKGAQ